MSYQRAETAIVLAGVEASRAFFAPCFGGRGRDSLWVAHVDEQARCIHLASYRRSERQPGLPAPVILRDAARLGSAGLVLAEGHSAEEARSAAADVRATHELASAADALGVTVLDYLLFAGTNCTSMRRSGLL